MPEQEQKQEQERERKEEDMMRQLVRAEARRLQRGQKRERSPEVKLREVKQRTTSAERPGGKLFCAKVWDPYWNLEEGDSSSSGITPQNQTQDACPYEISDMRWACFG